MNEGADGGIGGDWKYIAGGIGGIGIKGKLKQTPRLNERTFLVTPLVQRDAFYIQYLMELISSSQKQKHALFDKSATAEC